MNILIAFGRQLTFAAKGLSFRTFIKENGVVVTENCLYLVINQKTNSPIWNFRNTASLVSQLKEHKKTNSKSKSFNSSTETLT